MSTVDVVRTIKQVHPYDVILIKIGKFYHAYGRDAYVVSFVFNYQMKKVDINTNTTGFPETALNKVMKTLSEKNINYKILDRGDNYNSFEEEDFKQNNKYMDIYNTAHKYQVRKNKIDGIYEYLLSDINDEDLQRKVNEIEEILYERR